MKASGGVGAGVGAEANCGSSTSAGANAICGTATTAVSARSGRVACVMEYAGGSALALLAPGSGDAALLDWKTLKGPAGGVAFDARGHHLLVAMPEEGALAVWAVEGTTLRDTDMLVDTGPGVSAVAIAGE